MLHIPRPGRLSDPVNLRQLLEIERKYTSVKLVIAHVGRAYCDENLGNSMEILAGTRRMVFDISANTNTFIFSELLAAVGSKRVLFGSDLPITRMRMRRVCEEGSYVNLVPPGLYGDISTDSNMREVDSKEAESLTFFLYEELAALRRATMGMGRRDIEDICYGNAARLLEPD
jgi:predicted TIM-barrel fold metal-dependent hydrolase